MNINKKQDEKTKEDTLISGIDTVYISGKLFKDADVNARIEEGKKIRSFANADKTYVYNPIEHEIFGGHKEAMKILDLFWRDTKQLLNSKYVFAELDDSDPGVMAEISIAWAINQMRDFFDQGKTIDDFKKAFPKKDILCHLTDNRFSINDKFKGIDVPTSYNQFIIGMVKSQTQNKIFQVKDNLYKDFEDILKKDGNSK